MPALRYRFTNANSKAASPYTRPNRAGDSVPFTGPDCGPSHAPGPGLGLVDAQGEEGPAYEGDDEVEEYHSNDGDNDNSSGTTHRTRSCNQYTQEPLEVQHPKLPQLVQGYLNHGWKQTEIPGALLEEHGITLSLRSVQRLRFKHALKTPRCNGLTEEEQELKIKEVLMEWAIEDMASSRGTGKPPGTKAIKKRLAAMGIHITRSTITRIKRKLRPYEIDTILPFELPSPKPLPPPSVSKSKSKRKKSTRTPTTGTKKAAKVEKVETPEELAFGFDGLGVSDRQLFTSTATFPNTGLELYTHASSFLQEAPPPVSASTQPMNGTISMPHSGQPIKMPIPSHPPAPHTLLQLTSTHPQAQPPISPPVPRPTLIPAHQVITSTDNLDTHNWLRHPSRTGRMPKALHQMNVFAIPQYQHQHVTMEDGQQAMFPVGLHNSGRTGVQSQVNPYSMVQAQASQVPHAQAQGGHGQGYMTMDLSSVVNAQVGGNVNNGYMPVPMGHDAFGMGRLGQQSVSVHGQEQLSPYGWMQ